MQVYKYPLGQLSTNCYLLVKEGKCIIIDPADEASFLLEKIERQKLKLLALFATHGHFDHLMAAGDIQLSTLVPLYIFEQDVFLLKRINQTAKHFLGYNPHVLLPQKIKYFKPGKSNLENFNFHVFHTPGHTPGGACFYFEKEKIIFTGDTVFKNAVGRYDFSYCNKNDLKASVEQILSLPEETLIYPGHAEETFVGAEKPNFKLFF